MFRLFVQLAWSPVLYLSTDVYVQCVHMMQMHGRDCYKSMDSSNSIIRSQIVSATVSTYTYLVLAPHKSLQTTHPLLSIMTPLTPSSKKNLTLVAILVLSLVLSCILFLGISKHLLFQSYLSWGNLGDFMLFKISLFQCPYPSNILVLQSILQWIQTTSHAHGALLIPFALSYITFPLVPKEQLTMLLKLIAWSLYMVI
jgi:hypothetical protein